MSSVLTAAGFTAHLALLRSPQSKKPQHHHTQYSLGESCQRLEKDFNSSISPALVTVSFPAYLAPLGSLSSHTTATLSLTGEELPEARKESSKGHISHV